MTGSPGATYVLEVATNLGGGTWRPVFTNPAPFTFTDSNAAVSPQGFYHAIRAR